ncbi:Yip1-domain-containing protein [Roridomyces roridus]|uniref:Protein YIP n=1 Tax=Roridomyces roridus TaxID=1738132 RepID=A0AAD7CF36_9AGAR|nr:Yip1-domain-containing protein [Roridomyces roridus]
MWQDSTNAYGASSSAQQQPYYAQPQGAPLQFYSHQPPAGADPNSFYPGARPSLDGNVGAQGNINAGPTAGYGGTIQNSSWWTAFGTGGFEGEPPLLDELGINFSHILAKSLTVLNPLRGVNEHIMDDADLAGPFCICLCFAMFLMLSGKSNFGYVYGVGVLGSASIYTLLNLMSEKGIDIFRTASVLGYCLLPLVGLAIISVLVALDGIFGYLLSLVSISWCTYAASGIFVAVLRMSDQRLLVAYPIGLLYGCFSLLSVFK